MAPQLKARTEIQKASLVDAKILSSPAVGEQIKLKFNYKNIKAPRKVKLSSKAGQGPD